MCSGGRVERLSERTREIGPGTTEIRRTQKAGQLARVRGQRRRRRAGGEKGGGHGGKTQRPGRGSILMATVLAMAGSREITRVMGLGEGGFLSLREEIETYCDPYE